MTTTQLLLEPLPHLLWSRSEHEIATIVPWADEAARLSAKCGTGLVLLIVPVVDAVAFDTCSTRKQHIKHHSTTATVCNSNITGALME
jgi:hypothetical protein